MKAYYDAHNHLQDSRLRPWRDEILGALPAADIRGVVVNGTRESDWNEVAALAKEHPWIRPAYGLHPWHVAESTPDWVERLTELLQSDARTSVGEVGLDRWVEGFDLQVQLAALRTQWHLAARLDRVATVHCLRAWGHLVDFLKDQPPLRAFLLHSYGGSEELVAGFVERGAYFSFSPYFLHARKARQRETFAKIPLDRLLVETDAPDMLPPPEANENALADALTGAPLNHPLNLTMAYAALAELREMPVDELAGHVEANFVRVFGR